MNIGIIGAGGIAKKMAETLNQMPDMNAYAVSSRNENKALKFAEDNKVEKAYGSYIEMLKDENVDLVYIATPHSHHLEHGKLCIDFGKPVLCEKAFTANLTQTNELLDYAKEKGVFITEAIWTRYMPSRNIIDRIIKEGEIGEIKMVTADLGYDISHKERLIRPELAGGALLDVGIYPLNFASMVLGNDIERISSVCVKTDTGVDGQSSITLLYKDGKMAVLHTGMYAATEQCGIIYGTKGYIKAWNINNIDRIEIYTPDRKMKRSITVPEQITGYEYEVSACEKALKEGVLECPEMPHAETIQMMEWMDYLRKEWGIRYPFE